MLSKKVYYNSNASQTEVWGGSPRPPGDFSQFFGKKTFNTIGSHFARIQSYLKVLDF